jgi:hypothetical protein
MRFVLPSKVIIFPAFFVCVCECFEVLLVVGRFGFSRSFYYNVIIVSFSWLVWWWWVVVVVSYEEGLPSRSPLNGASDGIVPGEASVGLVLNGTEYVDRLLPLQLQSACSNHQSAQNSSLNAPVARRYLFLFPSPRSSSFTILFLRRLDGWMDSN